MFNSTLLSEGYFTLSFRGRTTSQLPVNASSSEVEESLEALSTVGSVNVTRVDAVGAGTYGFEHTIEFTPWEGHDSEHLLNYGDMPAISVKTAPILSLHNTTVRVYSSGVPSKDAVATQDGASPFAPLVSPGAVSPIHSTAVDNDGVADKQGLSTGYFESQTSFSIEARDRFGNRVYEGPLKEVQIIEVATSGGGNLEGHFVISYLEHSIDISAGASLSALEAAIEGLNSVGAVTVTTMSATNSTPFGNRTASVKTDSPYLRPSSDLSGVLQVGDWLR
ncbi:unnamed protein product, partial [Discosporangium mesarthrocarpum]